jgi:hypothetical protein
MRQNRGLPGELLGLSKDSQSPNQSQVIVSAADNPGIWIDHCRNLLDTADSLMSDLGDFGGFAGPQLVGWAP